MNFTEKAIRAEGGSEFRTQNLEGDRSVVPKIVREIHSGHTTAPELAPERVAITECFG